MFKKIAKFIGLGIAVLAVTALFMRQEWLMSFQLGMQNKFYDYDLPSSEIVVVAIDEKSLEEDRLGLFGQWKRSYYADAIEILNDADAAVVGIDVTFPDQSSHGSGDDAVLANVLEKYDNVVMASRYYFEDGMKVIQWPNNTLMSADPSLGWINVQLDGDGFVRSLPLFAASKNETIEAFSLALSRIYLNVDPVDYRIVGDEFNFSDNIVIPTITQRDSQTQQDVHSMYINYFAEPNRFTHISFSDVLDGNFIDKRGNPIDFTDKIVLIGPTAIDLQDDYLSPVSQGVRMPGVEIHANNIQTIITGQFLRDQSTLSLWITLLSFLAINIILFSFLKVRFAIPLVLAEVFGVLVAGIVGYEFRIFVNVIYPILIIFLSFIGTYLV
ncbi:CHASE2 domain-containing protein, partial [Patescibacteria group bacterium]|nr:CHASE2 domain-containing protein [Patescibacteria group bacterium]